MSKHKDDVIDLEDVIGAPKTGSVRAIARFIAMKGIVTRRELRERFKSGPVRTTITHLKQLGLVYSSPGRDGFVASIPWLLYLGEVGADWKKIVKARVPGVGEEELRELEKVLREARRGPLGAFVRQLVRTSRYESLYEEQVSKVMEVVPENCVRPMFGQRDVLRQSVKRCCPEDRAEGHDEQEDSGERCEECVYSLLERVSETYYQECIRPLLEYAQWLLVLIPAIAGRLYRQPGGEGLRELAEELAEQARELSRGATQLAWEVKLYSRTMHAVARLLRELEKHPPTYSREVETLSEHYRRVLSGLRDADRYNKSTVLRSFLGATIAKLLTTPPTPTG